jgi:hypothetical protein
MALWGVTPEDFQDEAVEVWPDNWPAVDFFAAIGPGAWSLNSGGPVGIRPEAFREIRLALGITAAQWRDIYPDVRVLEDAAVETMRASSK